MERFYTCKEVADRYHVKTHTVWAWIREGKLSAVTVANRLYRIRQDDLDAFEKGTIAVSANIK